MTDRVSDPGTYSVSELAAEIRDFLSEAYRSLWVAGEIQRLHTSQRGHLYFEMVEKGHGDRIVGKIDAVAWRTDAARIHRLLERDGQALREGMEIRCRGAVDFYPEGGRLQLVVREVDPLFTLGLLERRRRETLQALSEAGLLERNKSLPLPDVPLRLGLVTSDESAAYHDFLSALARSGYGFEVTFVHAATQGAAAEREVPAALRLLADLRLQALDSPPLDAVVLIRGGGSRADLQAFDSRPVALAVARAPWPVVTGLGHETDRSIADMVSHSAVGTPSKAAELLVSRVEDAEDAVEELRGELGRLAAERLQRATADLARCERLPQVARLQLQAAERGLDHRAETLGRAARRRLAEAGQGVDALRQRLLRAAPRPLVQQGPRADALAERLAAAAGAHLATQRAVLDGIARLCTELQPQRVLERGFSITRTASGAIVSHPDDLPPGAVLETRLAHGHVRSRRLPGDDVDGNEG